MPSLSMKNLLGLRSNIAGQHPQSDQKLADVHSGEAVNWPVIAWILLQLAINSMTQPSGHICSFNRIPRKYRIYLCLSPVLCLADAISILISMLATQLTLGTSIAVSARYVWFFRLYPNKRNEADGKEPFELWNIHRCIVFVGGTLPALVKLSFFSGLPWSKAWGLMFALSFIVIEFLNIAAVHDPNGVPRSEVAALGLSVGVWDAEVNRTVRQDVENLSLTLALVNGLPLMLAAACHIALFMWTISNLLRSCISDNFGMSLGFLNINMWIQIISGIVSTVFIVIAGLVKLICWGYSLSSRLTWKRIIFYYYACVAVPTLCYLHPLARGERQFLATYRLWLAITIATTIVCYATYKALFLLCSRLPSVNRALLVTKTELNPTSEKERSNDFKHKIHRDKIDQLGLYCVTGFCLQLSVGLLWYAYRYDSVGTSRPPWIDGLG